MKWRQTAAVELAAWAQVEMEMEEDPQVVDPLAWACHQTNQQKDWVSVAELEVEAVVGSVEESAAVLEELVAEQHLDSVGEAGAVVKYPFGTLDTFVDVETTIAGMMHGICGHMAVSLHL